MAIAESQQVRRRGWGGFGAPYPVGHWAAFRTVSMDASGGLVAVTFTFQPATSPELDSNLYSIEQVTVGYSDETDAIRVHLVSQNLDQEAGAQTRTLALRSDPLAAALAPTEGALRMFLGSQRVTGTASGIVFSAVNTNLESITFSAQGYIWDSRSRSMVGGPRRPVDGLYSC